MNTINQIIILIILFLLINYLVEGKLVEKIYLLFNNCKTNIENFMGSTITNNKGVYFNTPDFPYQNQKDFCFLTHRECNEETYNLYRFLNNLVSPNINNYSMTSYNSERKTSANIKNNIITQLSKLLNQNYYKFTNIVILDDIYYYNNVRGIDIEPFSFTANVNYKNKNIGKIKIYMETYLKKETKILTILNIRLQDLQYIDDNEVSKNSAAIDMLKITPHEIDAMEKTNKLAVKMDDSFNNYFVKRTENELFIKSDNHTEDSLIPSYVNLDE
jgi:hypothetical protein